MRRLLNRHPWLRRMLAVPLRLRAAWLERSGRRGSPLYAQVVVGGDIIVRPLNLPGEFSVDARSHLAQRVVQDGVYEPEMLPLLKRVWPGSGVCINVGANVGFWAVSVALSLPDVDQVVAIEPNPEAFDRLRSNIVRNGVDSLVRPVQACVSDVRGEVEFSLVPGKPEYSSIGSVEHPSLGECAVERVRIEAQPLQDLLDEDGRPVSLLLLDTEGAEYLVLSGSRAMLEEDQPVVVFECSAALLQKFGHSVAMVRRFFEEIGYDVRDAAAPHLQLPDDFVGEALALPGATTRRPSARAAARSSSAGAGGAAAAGIGSS